MVKRGRKPKAVELAAPPVEQIGSIKEWLYVDLPNASYQISVGVLLDMILKNHPKLSVNDIIGDIDKLASELTWDEVKTIAFQVSRKKIINTNDVWKAAPKELI